MQPVTSLESLKNLPKTKTLPESTLSATFPAYREGQVAERLKALVSKSTNTKSHPKIIIKYQTVKIVNLSVLYLHMCYTLFANGVVP